MKDFPLLDIKPVQEFIDDAKSRPHPRIPVKKRLQALDTVARQWLSPDYPLRKETVEKLVRHTGLPEAMISSSLDLNLRFLTFPDCEKLFGFPLKDLRVMEKPVRYLNAQYLLSSPGLTLFWMPGNLPGPALIDLGLAVLAGGPFIMRVSSHEPYLASAFWHDITRASPDFSPYGLVGTWDPSNHTYLESMRSLLSTVVAYGYETTLKDLHDRLPTYTRFLSFPHRISMALVEPGYFLDDPSAYDRLARDIAWFNQLGCMSPHHIFIVTSSKKDLEHFLDRLAGALERMNEIWPVRIPDEGTAMRIQSLRAEMMTAKSSLYRLGPDLTWGLFVTAFEHLQPICGYRHAFIHTLERVENFQQILFSLADRYHLQTLGIGLRRRPEPAWFQQIASLGFRRFCSIGRMQEPAVPGCHDGRPRLLDLLTCVSLELDDAS